MLSRRGRVSKGDRPSALAGARSGPPRAPGLQKLPGLNAGIACKILRVGWQKLKTGQIRDRQPTGQRIGLEDNKLTASRRARLVRVAVLAASLPAAGGGVGRLPARAAAGRHEAEGQGTGVEPAHRAADVQPLRRARLGAGNRHPPHAGQARPDQPADAGARAVAGRVVDRVARRPHLHAETAPRRHLLGRRAVHVGRRAVRVQGDLRREDAADSRRVDPRRREAAGRERAGRIHGGRALPVGRSARASGCSTTLPSCRATSWRRR